MIMKRFSALHGESGKRKFLPRKKKDMQKRKLTVTNSPTVPGK